MCIPYCDNSDLQEIFLSKTNSIFTGSNVIDAAVSNIVEFLLRDTCVSSSQANRRVWSKQSLSSP
jgi:hypothetical protein